MMKASYQPTNQILLAFFVFTFSFSLIKLALKLNKAQSPRCINIQPQIKLFDTFHIYWYILPIHQPLRMPF